jgi:hypothetical protein
MRPVSLSKLRADLQPGLAAAWIDLKSEMRRVFLIVSDRPPLAAGDLETVLRSH